MITASYSVHGTRMFLHPLERDIWVSRFLARNLAYEPFETEWIQHLARPGDVVLDIGAHIGYYTLLLSKAVGPAGTVHAFEPDPANVALLERNLAHNGCENVVAHRCALADEHGTRSLYLCEDNAGDHRLWQASEGRRSVSVATVPLDELLWSPAFRVGLVKMDVQGAEGLVLRGMRRILRLQSRVALFTEYWPFGLEQAGAGAAEFLGGLVEIGFALFLIDERRRALHRVEATDLLRGVRSEPNSFTNLLCLKR